jgi:di/tripeptidase
MTDHNGVAHAPSGHEQAVSRFVADFGRSLGLETTVRTVGNVPIREPSTTGMGRRQAVAFQAHLDLFPHKASGKVFDFEKDPIDAYVEDGWVKADGRTLGADDALGVATIMAILQARDLLHGPIEALFTVDEEGDVKAAYPEETVPTGMVAHRLDFGRLQGGHSGLEIDYAASRPLMDPALCGTEVVVPLRRRPR